MVLLAVETSTPNCSVALLAKNHTYTREQQIPREQGDHLLGMITDLLAEAQISLDAITCLAYGEGPGSFTGLRVGASVMQALAFSHNLPVIPVSSLWALAEFIYKKNIGHTIVVAQNAYQGEIYWGSYQYDEMAGILMPHQEDQLSPPEKLLVKSNAPWIACGNAWEVYPSELKDQLNTSADYVNLSAPHAREVSKLAQGSMFNAKAVSAENVLPVYLRERSAWR